MRSVACVLSRSFAQNTTSLPVVGASPQREFSGNLRGMRPPESPESRRVQAKIILEYLEEVLYLAVSEIQLSLDIHGCILTTFCLVKWVIRG